MAVFCFAAKKPWFGRGWSCMMHVCVDSVKPWTTMVLVTCFHHLHPSTSQIHLIIIYQRLLKHLWFLSILKEFA